MPSSRRSLQCCGGRRNYAALDKAQQGPLLVRYSPAHQRANPSQRVHSVSVLRKLPVTCTCCVSVESVVKCVAVGARLPHSGPVFNIFDYALRPNYWLLALFAQPRGPARPARHPAPQFCTRCGGTGARTGHASKPPAGALLGVPILREEASLGRKS